MREMERERIKDEEEKRLRASEWRAYDTACVEKGVKGTEVNGMKYCGGDQWGD